MSKSGLEFSVGDHVVYPAHGVGEVTAIEKREIGGVAGTFKAMSSGALRLVGSLGVVGGSLVGYFYPKGN